MAGSCSDILWCCEGRMGNQVMISRKKKKKKKRNKENEEKVERKKKTKRKKKEKRKRKRKGRKNERRKKKGRRSKKKRREEGEERKKDLLCGWCWFFHKYFERVNVSFFPFLFSFPFFTYSSSRIHLIKGLVNLSLSLFPFKF